MTYSLFGDLEHISCPVILVAGGQQFRHQNGISAVQQKFDKMYLVDKMFARNGEIIVCLKENKQINATNWCGEEQVSFF